MTYFIYCDYIFTYYWDSDTYTRRKLSRKTEERICRGEYESAKNAHEYNVAAAKA